jgi:hypothetical protein
MRDKETGGFYNFKDKPRERQRLDIWTSSQAGLACLAVGRMAEAEETGMFLEAMMDLQPDPEKSFTTSISRVRDY